MVLQMIKRADAAKCFISGLKDFRNQQTGVTLAHCLATYGLQLALETVIENDKEIVHLVDNSGFTLLHCAAKFGQFECIKVLIRHGASIKARDILDADFLASILTSFSRYKFLKRIE